MPYASPTNWAPSAAGLRSRVAAAASSGWLWVAVVILLSLIVYLPAVGNWFVFDDFNFLRAGRNVPARDFVAEAFSFEDYDRYDDYLEHLRADDTDLPYLAYRPLYFVSLEAMYLAFGEDPAGYHLVSIAVHIVNTLLVWRIASRFLRGGPGPVLAAAVFALHPAYVETVGWISDVTTLLATSTALLSLLLLMKSIEGPRFRLVSYLGSLASYTASLYFHLETVAWVIPLGALALFAIPAAPTLRLEPKRLLLLIPFGVSSLGSYALHSWIASNTPVQEGIYHLGPHMLTHFKNLMSNALYPRAPEDELAHYVAFVAMLAVMASYPVLAYLARRSLISLLVALFVVVWFLVSVALLTSVDVPFPNGVLNRKLYVAGPALSILIVMFGAQVLAVLPRRVYLSAGWLGILVVLFCLLGAMSAASHEMAELSETADDSERFVSALREEYPSLPQGSTVYVVGAPFAMRLFGDVQLVKAVKAFYTGVDAYNVSRKEARALEPTLQDDEYIFRYRGERW